MKQTPSRLSARGLLAVIVATLAVNGGLIASTIGKWSVWHDEGFSIMLAQYPVKELLSRAALDVHPPLYYLLLKAWGSVFGWSDIAVRSLSALLGLVAIALTLLLCHKFFGKRPTILLAPMLAIAPVLTRYSQEARMYTLAMVLCLAIIYAYVKFKEVPSSWRWRITFVVASTLLIYTHYFASLILLAPLLNELWELKGQSLKLLIARVKYLAPLYIGMLALVAPWLPKLYDQVHVVRGGFWIGPVTGSSLISTISSFIIFRPEWHRWRLMGGYAVLAALMMVVVVVLSKRASSNGTITSRLIVLSWVIPIVILFVMSAFNYNYYYDRYFSSFAPFFFMTLALGLSRLRLRYLLPVGAILVSMLFVGVYNASVHGNNYGHDVGDEFSMKQVYKHIEQSPYIANKYVATDLGVYFDLRSYLVASNRAEPVILLEKPTDKPGKYGNTSLIYDRTDLLLKDLPSLETELAGGSYVWYVTHAKNDPLEKVPVSWTQVDTYQTGYARAHLYKLP